MRSICSIFTAVILLQSASLSALEKLPEEIYFRNLEQGFSYEYLYALKDGKIWVKPNKKNTGADGEWKLFNKTGLPSGKHAESFEPGDRVTQFSTEGTMIVALSDKGRLYFWQPTYFGETVWREKTGAPFSGILSLPENRTWCFAFSTMKAPWKRQTPMHEKDIVSYWEDIDGNKTEFGFTASIYVVDPSGQKIYFTDTGLPTSWGKAIASPERGRFIIESMSASASTLFVINGAGRMYTRMYDFELDGGCPALRFVYNRERRTEGDDVAPLMTSIRTHPLPGWREQEPIAELLPSEKNKKSKAAITKNITILLTGQGNAARELRVQGRDSRGNYGYWRKMLFDSSWEFVVTGEEFREADIITDYHGKAPEGKTFDKNYTGRVTKPGEPELKAELLGFHYFDTPATLRIHTGDSYFDMKLHTVDLWSPTVQKKYHPELVGHVSGEPKLLQGAIEISDDVLNSTNPAIKRAVDSYFREFNRQPIAFTISADDRTVYMESKTLQRSLHKSLDYEFYSSIKFYFENVDYNSESSGRSIFTEIAVRPGLMLPGDTSFMTVKDIPAIDKLIEANEKAVDEIEEINKSLKRESCASGCASSCILPLYYIFNGVITVIGLPHWNMDNSSPGTRENITQLGGVSYTGGTPLKEHAAMNLKEAFDDPEDYERALKIIDNRLAELKSLRQRLSSGGGR